MGFLRYGFRWLSVDPERGAIILTDGINGIAAPKNHATDETALKAPLLWERALRRFLRRAS